MLRISINNPNQNQHLELTSGPVEFGRAARDGVNRVVITDPSVSRDQLRVEELPDGRIRVENLSRNRKVVLDDGTTLGVGACRELRLPARMGVGATELVIGRG